MVRHAKSSWAFPELKDIDRPLNKRGERDAPKMATHLQNSGYSFDLIISSPAKRTLVTSTIFGEVSQLPLEEIIVDERLFHASVKEIIDVVGGIGNRFKSVAIFGHNPGLTEFVNRISGSDIDNIPTTGIAIIDLAFNTWDSIGDSQGELKEYLYPKMLPNSR